MQTLFQEKEVPNTKLSVGFHQIVLIQNFKVAIYLLSTLKKY